MEMLKSIFFIPLFFIANTYAQDWQKKKNDKKIDSMYATYSRQEPYGQHPASGNLVLLKSGRFKYSSIRPIYFEQFSEGIFSIRKDTLILNSYAQPENLSVTVEYVDSLNTDSSYDRLPLPKNLNGEVLNGYYLINSDTIANGFYVSGFPIGFNYKNLIDSMYRLKVKTRDGDFGSKWIPIAKTDKFIRVLVLTEKDFSYYKPVVITNYKFLIKGNKLVDISNSKMPL
jgi:hypothetical protein